MFMFAPELAPLLILLVTAGIKSIFGGISGYVSMLVASGVGALLLFGESLIGGLGPDAGAVATAIVELLLVIAGSFGLYDLIRDTARRVRVG